TDGAYDPTILPLELAWNIHGAGRVPPPDERLAARALVGWQGVIRQPGGQLRFAREGVGLDLDGTARGLSLDRGAAMLRARGMEPGGGGHRGPPALARAALIPLSAPPPSPPITLERRGGPRLHDIRRGVAGIFTDGMAMSDRLNQKYDTICRNTVYVGSFGAM